MSKTDVTTRATRREIFQLIATTDLPLPKEVAVRANGILSMAFDDHAAFEQWSALMHIDRIHSERKPTDDGQLFSMRGFNNFRGYHGWITLNEPAPADSQQPVMTGERAEEILAGLNSFVVPEVEGGTEIRDGVAVPVAEQTGILDCGLEHAVDWARRQPELASFTDPAFPNLLRVAFADGSIAAWVPDFKRWCWVVEP